MHTDLPILQVQVIDRLSPAYILPITVVGMALLTGTIIALSAIVITNWRGFRERRIAASLIQEMLDRNMSPAEIQQVMSTWSGDADRTPRCPDRPARPEIPMRPPKSAKPYA